MESCAVDCPIEDIPPRLHTKDRQPLSGIPADDWLYMRHPPLPVGESYGFAIPDHRVEDQSVNAASLSGDDGSARDVLYNTRTGEHFHGHQIARFGVFEVEELVLLNPNTVIKRTKEGTALNEQDKFTFKVHHDPTPCMYPHCEIRVYKNGELSKSISSAMKTIIRRSFALIAEKHRTVMLGLS